MGRPKRKRRTGVFVEHAKGSQPSLDAVANRPALNASGAVVHVDQTRNTCQPSHFHSVGSNGHEGAEEHGGGRGEGGGAKSKSRRKRARSQKRKAAKQRERKAARKDRREETEGTAVASNDVENSGDGAGTSDQRKRCIAVFSNSPEVKLAPITTATSDGDCYDKVMRGSSVGTNNTIEASWLKGVQWLCAKTEDDDALVSRNGRSDSTHGHDQTSNDSDARIAGSIEKAASSRNALHGAFCCCQSSSSQSQENQRLYDQLCEMKRRLWPAAQECARVRSSMIQNMVSIEGNEQQQERTGESSASNPEEKTGIVEDTMNLDNEAVALEFELARRACNPFEALGEGRRGGLNSMFVNRSAMKLANIDAMLGFPFAKMIAEEATAGVANEERQVTQPFLFVDLCGAPGGFSEYLLYRAHEADSRGQSCRGYGMSLSGTNQHGTGLNWQLDHMAAMDVSGEANFHVCVGADGTGDIYNMDNVLSLRDEIQSREQVAENQAGLVDLVVADGGFDAQRDSDKQEMLAHRIVASQAAAAMLLLRQGGSFVIKMFGFRTSQMRRMVHDLAPRFEKLSIVKPVTSRPASAERYLVCSSFCGLEPEWDVLKWRDEILLSCSDVTSDKVVHGEILAYLDSIDGDILTLNIHACSAILAFLQTMASDEGGHSVPTAFLPSSRMSLDLKKYRSAWKIR